MKFPGNIMVFCFIGLLMACGRGETTKTAVEYMPNMMDSLSVKAQEAPMRVPVPGTRPIGFYPYPYAKEEGDLAGAALTNPLPLKREVLLGGQKTFNTYCIVCHGPEGKGNGLIVPKFPMPPSLHSEKVRGWPDGRIFHVITRGQNLMPSYASQISENERWAVIYYMRALQRSVNPTPEDVEAYQKALKEGTNP